MITLYNYLNEGLFDADDSDISTTIDNEARLAEISTQIQRTEKDALSRIAQQGDTLLIVVGESNPFLTLDYKIIEMLHGYIRENNIQKLSFENSGRNGFVSLVFYNNPAPRDFFDGLEIETSEMCDLSIDFTRGNKDVSLSNTTIKSRNLELECGDTNVQNLNFRNTKLQVEFLSLKFKNIPVIPTEFVALIKRNRIENLSISYYIYKKDLNAHPTQKAIRSAQKAIKDNSPKTTLIPRDAARLAGDQDLLNCKKLRFTNSEEKPWVYLNKSGSKWIVSNK